MKTDLFQSCGHCWVFQIFWHTECSTFLLGSANGNNKGRQQGCRRKKGFAPSLCQLSLSLLSQECPLAPAAQVISSFELLPALLEPASSSQVPIRGGGTPSVEVLSPAFQGLSKLTDFAHLTLRLVLQPWGSQLLHKSISITPVFPFSPYPILFDRFPWLNFLC